MEKVAQQTIQPRDPNTVMTLARLGAAHQTRLSFMRQLLRRLVRDDWTITQTVFDIDANGVGHAVYTAQGPEHAYSLVAFAHDLPPDQRSDRVIATARDATFTLFDGIPTEADIARLRDNVPLQEAGRISDRELSLSRANRSVRLWDHVVEALSAGHQPDEDQVRAVGYLMRTTAVYGSGKFGAADREQTRHRPECAGPFGSRCCRSTSPAASSWTLSSTWPAPARRRPPCRSTRPCAAASASAIPPASAWRPFS